MVELSRDGFMRWLVTDRELSPSTALIYAQRTARLLAEGPEVLTLSGWSVAKSAWSSYEAYCVATGQPVPPQLFGTPKSVSTVRPSPYPDDLILAVRAVSRMWEPCRRESRGLFKYPPLTSVLRQALWSDVHHLSHAPRRPTVLTPTLLWYATSSHQVELAVDLPDNRPLIEAFSTFWRWGGWTEADDRRKALLLPSEPRGVEPIPVAVIRRWI